jgi:hypothetical protein
VQQRPRYSSDTRRWEEQQQPQYRYEEPRSYYQQDSYYQPRYR